MRISGACLTAVMLMSCGGAFAADQKPSGTSSFKADKIEQVGENILMATGNVEVVGSNFKLQADSVEMRKLANAGEQSVEYLAEGHVVLTRGTERLTFERLEFNPSAGTGTFRLSH